MRSFHFLATAHMIAACGLALPTAAAEPPPEKLKVNYAAVGSELGYVTFLGYFSDDEVNDPLWEFARIQRAGLNWCRSESRFRQRDIRWFDATPTSGKRCAAVIYTVECLEPREEIADKIKPPFHNGLEQARDAFLSGPAQFPVAPNCGPRDAK